MATCVRVDTQTGALFQDVTPLPECTAFVLVSAGEYVEHQKSMTVDWALASFFWGAALTTVIFCWFIGRVFAIFFRVLNRP